MINERLTLGGYKNVKIRKIKAVITLHANGGSGIQHGIVFRSSVAPIRGAGGLSFGMVGFLTWMRVTSVPDGIPLRTLVLSVSIGNGILEAGARARGSWGSHGQELGKKRAPVTETSCLREPINPSSQRWQSHV